MLSNNILLMNLNSPIDYTLLQNKFLNLLVVLWFWDFCRSHDQKESGGSGIHEEFAKTSHRSYSDGHKSH